MDKDGILAALRDRSAFRDGSVPRGKAENRESLRRETLNRLSAAMTTPRSFDELEWELPPEARYLGPGIWMEAIKDAVRYGKK